MPLLLDLHATAPAAVEDLPKTDTPDVAPTGDAGDTRRPGASEQIQRSTRGLLVAFAVFTLLAVSSLLLLADHTDRFFAWPITSRPNSAFLGAAYGAGFVLSVLAVWQRRWSRVRVALVTVTAFTVLTLIPTVLHKHRLNLMADVASARLAAWVWLAVYVVIPVACVVVVVRQHRQRDRGQALDPGRPMPRRLVALLVAQGTALAAVGAVLYAGGAATHMMVAVQRPGWPWPVTPLTSQAIGAWLLSFGFAIALALREGDLSRMFVPAGAYAGFGLFEVVVLLSYRTSAGTDGRWLWLDLVVFATMVPTGAYGAWTARRSSRPTPRTRSV